MTGSHFRASLLTLASCDTCQNRFVLFCHSRLFPSSKKISHYDTASQLHFTTRKGKWSCNPKYFSNLLEAGYCSLSSIICVVICVHTHTRKYGIWAVTKIYSLTRWRQIDFFPPTLITNQPISVLLTFINVPWICTKQGIRHDYVQIYRKWLQWTLNIYCLLVAK